MKRDPDCTLCPLGYTADFVCLLGAGPTPCPIMAIGEAPDEREDERGQAFVGKAGKLLNSVLEDVGIEREDIYVTNAVHCRPPENRKPRSHEIESCFIWLMREIRLVQPKFLLILGGVPLEAIRGEKVKITQERGKIFSWNGITCMPTFHPAYILRAEREMATFRADLQKFAEISGFSRSSAPKSRVKLDIHEVTDKNSFFDMLDDMLEFTELGGDFETSQLSPWGPEAWPVSFGVSTPHRQWIIPINHHAIKPALWDWITFPRALKRIMQATRGKGVTWIGQNWKFDNLWLRVHAGVDRRVDFDTMLAHHLLDENSRHDLETLALRYLGEAEYDIPLSDKQGRTGTWEKHAEYLAKDIAYLHPLKHIFEQQLKQDPALWRLFTSITMPLARMMVDVEYRGVYLDMSKLKDAQAFWRDKKADAEERLNRVAKINWGSPIQVADVLFNQLKITPLEKTKGNKNATNESVLKRLGATHEVARDLLDFRAAKQQLSHFLEGWIPHIHESRLHPSFKLHGTVTGRLSCENPNLQQVPRDARIRSLITAPPGWIFFKADLSQIELRIAAHMANERTMKAAMLAGRDVHWMTLMRELMRTGAQKTIVLSTASAIENRDVRVYGEALRIVDAAGPKKCEGINPVWKELRKKAKAVNFGYLYGMWWKKFIIYARDNYDVIVTESEARESRVDYFQLYPGLNDWHKRQKRFVRLNGYVRSLFGRKRRLPMAQTDPESPIGQEAMRQAINAPVQSTASEWNACAAIELSERFGRDELWITGLVHDEIIGEIREDRAEVILPVIEQVMTAPKIVDMLKVNMSVPIEAECEVGPWNAGIPAKVWLSKNTNT